MTASRRPKRAALLGTGHRATVAAAAVAMILGVTAVAAHAEPDPPAVEATVGTDRAQQFSYSSDGVAYSAAVPALFAGSPKLVPGEGIEGQLWVRNENTVAVEVSVAALVPGGAAGDAQVRLTPSASVTLDPGAAAPMPVQLWIPESAGNASQGITLAVRLQINATEAVDAGGGELGSTGATPGIWPLAAAALLGGVAARLGAKRRSRAETTGQTTESEDHGE